MVEALSDRASRPSYQSFLADQSAHRFRGQQYATRHHLRCRHRKRRQWGSTQPAGLLLGAVLLALHGSTYLNWRTGGELQARIRKAASRLWWLVAGLSDFQREGCPDTWGAVLIPMSVRLLRHRPFRARVRRDLGGGGRQEYSVRLPSLRDSRCRTTSDGRRQSRRPGCVFCVCCSCQMPLTRARV